MSTVNEISEYALCAELAVLEQQRREAGNLVRHHARRAMDAGCRARPIYEQLGMSKATFYRWLIDFE